MDLDSRVRGFPATAAVRLGAFLIAALFASSAVVASTAFATSPQSEVSVLSTVSSTSCENNDSLFSDSFSCSLNVVAGSTIVAFFGCLSTDTADCSGLSAVDSQNNVYMPAERVAIVCDGAICVEQSYFATASLTGSDTLTFTTAEMGYLGGDVYDIAGLNTTLSNLGASASPGDGVPLLGVPMTAYPNGMVLAGVVANNNLAFSAGGGYTLIPGQPAADTKGAWQAAESEIWGSTGSTTEAPFGYPSTNDGWAEVAVSVGPNVDTTSVTCATSPVSVGMATACTATVKGSFPTGTVTWTTNGTGTFSPSSSCSLSSGSCSVTYTPSHAASPVVVTASYGGDVENPQNSGRFSLSVVKSTTTTTVVCSPSPVSTGSPSTCTASVSGVSPTGTITWASSGVANFSPAATCTLSAGSCAVNYTPSSASMVTITAIYGGDGDNAGTSGAFALSVSAATSSSTTTTSSSTTSTTLSVSSAPPSSSTTSTLSPGTTASISSTTSGASSSLTSSTATITSAASSSTTQQLSTSGQSTGSIPASSSSSTGASSSSLTGSYALVVSLDVFLILAVLFLRARSGASSRTVPNAHP